METCNFAQEILEPYPNLNGNKLYKCLLGGLCYGKGCIFQRILAGIEEIKKAKEKK